MCIIKFATYVKYMDRFKLAAPYEPTGDQPGREALVKGIENGISGADAARGNGFRQDLYHGKRDCP